MPVRSLYMGCAQLFLGLGEFHNGLGYLFRIWVGLLCLFDGPSLYLVMLELALFECVWYLYIELNNKSNITKELHNFLREV